MSSSTTVVRKIDWICILLYMMLVAFGWVNIYSASVPLEEIGHFNIDSEYGKQLIFIGLCVVIIIFSLAIEAKFYERFASVIYMVSLVSLVGLFLFGKNVNGAKAWYSIGTSTIQPGEFAKAATALAIAKFLSDIQTQIKKPVDQLRALLIIAIPALLILLEPDPGTVLVFSAFIFVLYREGLPGAYILLMLSVGVVFVTTIKFDVFPVLLVLALLLIAFYIWGKRRKKRRIRLWPLVALFAICSTISLSTPYIYNHVLKQHHRDRFRLWLRMEKDPVVMERLKKDIGYNTYQSENAIRSGGFSGKGFLEGTRTRGNYVPEQHTDYIFTTVGEEWGFIGTSAVVLLFMLLILRIIYLAERQRAHFSRVYGYSVAGIICIHFLVNIGMVIGVLPTIGIPLPFFSYGGSGLWGFTILLFVFLKLDANRVHDWM